MLRIANAGDVLGLSAAISAQTYECTAEALSACEINLIDRRSMISLVDSHPEILSRTIRYLSRDLQAAYRRVGDLLLSTSVSRKVVHLLISCLRDCADECACPLG